MIEFALTLALSGAGGVQQTQPRTYTPPQPIYTPPPVGSETQPIVFPSPKPLQTPPPAPSGNWKDKMWERYKQRTGTN